ncbi:MAG: energy-coupled thiamine transporter ThiT [Clostridia bacterium]|nr:energy-coupled thiamine transporter ThiT [Clostridia bacterium]
MKDRRNETESKKIRKRNHDSLTAMIEGAVMAALAVALELIPLPFRMPYGGSVSLGAIPIVYYSYRRGTGRGLAAGLIFAGVQMLMGFYVPPAGNAGAIIACILLDYVFAFAFLGTADMFAKPFERFSRVGRLTGYAFGAAAVSAVRFICSFLSGIVLWGSYAPEGVDVWYYSLVYNGGYMLPNALICSAAMVMLCAAVDPKTTRPMKKN